MPKPENTVYEAGPNQTPPPSVPDAGVLNALKDELEQVKEEANRWKKEADEDYERLLRARVDLENFRRSTRKDEQNLAKYAAAPLMESLLPVIDNLERALDAGPRVKKLKLSQGCGDDLQTAVTKSKMVEHHRSGREDVNSR